MSYLCFCQALSYHVLQYIPELAVILILFSIGTLLLQGKMSILDAKLFSTHSLDDVLVMRFLAAFIVKALPIKRHFCKLRLIVLLMLNSINIL